MNRSRPLTVLVAAGVCATLLLSPACSQNEIHPSGPAPEAPKNPRVARVVPKEGSGMNPMPAEEPAPAPAKESQARGELVYHGEVSLAPELKGRFPKGAVLFIVARDPRDPASPLAARKVEAASFPLHFDLSDADSMTGSPLPAEVELLAKLSATGAVDVPSPEDLEAGPVRAWPGAPAVLVLNKRR